MANNLDIPLSNPVKFFKVNRTVTAKYGTKHFDQFMFDERLYNWEIEEDFVQIWQTTDIINEQFESNFDPITVELRRWSDDKIILTLPALIGLPNLDLPGQYSYKINMSLAAIVTGCYYLRLIAGIGESQEIYESCRQYISSTPIKDSFCIEYWSSKDFHDDVIFKDGWKFQYRMFGVIGRLKPGRTTERYKDQRYNPTVLSAKPFRRFPIYFGDKYGIPDDVIDLLNSIWCHDNVTIDSEFFCMADEEFEFVEIDRKPKRGCKATFEPGLNRRSVRYEQNVDTTKRLVFGISVTPKIFGDLSNSGSSNTVPIFGIIE